MTLVMALLVAMASENNIRLTHPLRWMPRVGNTSSKIILKIHAKPFTGSSALQAFLHRGLGVSTLCDGMRIWNTNEMIWQCEPNKAAIKPDTLQIVGHYWEMQPNATEVLFRDLNITRKIQFLAMQWDMKKPILVCKFCDLCNHSTSSDICDNLHDIQTEMETSKDKVIPIFIWRPLCMWPLSHNTKKKERDDSNGTFFISQIHKHEEFIHDIFKLGENKMPFLVINTADLIWNEKMLITKLNSIFPQMKLTAIPAVIEKTKVIPKFGEMHPPDVCCNYSLSTHECKRWPDNLSSMWKMRAQMAHQQLLMHTLDNKFKII